MTPRDIGILETLRDPRLYTPRQLQAAMLVAYAIGRARFVLLEEPEDKP